MIPGKKLIVEFVDEDISAILAEQRMQQFLEELNSLELKYSLMNQIEIEEAGKNKEDIDHFKKWYSKNH